MRTIFLAVCAVSALSACSSQQLYSSGQSWQRDECRKILDTLEYERCMAKTNMSHEQYKSEMAKGAK